jgi:uncharacterized coiled-coil protein SlyX
MTRGRVEVEVTADERLDMLEQDMGEVERRLDAIEDSVEAELKSWQSMRRRMGAFLARANSLLAAVGADEDPEAPRPPRRPGRRVH